MGLRRDSRDGARGAARVGPGALDEGTVWAVLEGRDARVRRGRRSGGTTSLSTLISSGGHCKIPAKHTQKRCGRILKAYVVRYKI